MRSYSVRQNEASEFAIFAQMEAYRTPGLFCDLKGVESYTINAAETLANSFGTFKQKLANTSSVVHDVTIGLVIIDKDKKPGFATDRSLQ